jgi:hypothetical protein
MDDGLERKRRWFGDDEFVYDLEAATKVGFSKPPLR